LFHDYFSSRIVLAKYLWEEDMRASFKIQNKRLNVDSNIKSYLKSGEQRAINLGNRGPIKFDPDGQLAADIRESYSDIGFYVFENVINSDELKDLAQDLDSILESLPEKKGAKLTKAGKKSDWGRLQSSHTFLVKAIRRSIWRNDISEWATSGKDGGTSSRQG
jgi:hypothetical protein